MPKILQVINISLDRKALSGSDFTIKTQPWREGDLIVIDAVCISCVDSTNKYAAVGILQGSRASYYETVKLTTANYVYPTSVVVYFWSDSRLIIKILNPDSGDLYHVNVFGRILEAE